MNKLSAVGGVTGLALAAVLATQGRAAGRVEPAVVGNPMADITDVYAWMSGTNVNLVLDVSPRDDGTHAFGPDVLYVFHLTSKAGLGVGTTAGTETRLTVRFASGTSVQVWATDGTGTKEYLSGDPSQPAGLSGTKLRMFAGRRSDPAFFNGGGFAAAMAALAPQAAQSPDGAGCPAGLSATAAGQLRTQLATGGDDLAAANVMSIVIQLDRSLVNSGSNTALAVWASTHAAVTP